MNPSQDEGVFSNDVHTVRPSEFEETKQVDDITFHYQSQVGSDVNKYSAVNNSFDASMPERIK